MSIPILALTGLLLASAWIPAAAEESAEKPTLQVDPTPTIRERSDAETVWSSGAIQRRQLVHLDVGSLLDRYVTAWNELSPDQLNLTWHGLSPQRKPSVSALLELIQGQHETKVAPNRTMREYEIIGANSRGDLIVEVLFELTPSRLDMVANPTWERALLTMRREQTRLKIWTISLVEAGGLAMVEASHYQFSDARMRQLAREHFAREERSLIYQIGFMDGLALADLHGGVVDPSIVEQLDADPNSPNEHKQGVSHGIILGAQFIAWAAKNPIANKAQ